MNALVGTTESNTTILQLPEETKSLIKVSIAENTLKAYQHALQSLTSWLAGRILSDALLATYITELHRAKSPATISQVVAAVKWHLNTSPTVRLNSFSPGATSIINRKSTRLKTSCEQK